MRIAVVIPTLNEAEHLPALLRSLAAEGPDRVVVADCGSADATAALARDAGAEVVTAAHLDSRAASLRAGVEACLSGSQAKPDALWLLHADSLAPPGWRDAIASALADPAVVAGAFTQRFYFASPPLDRPPGWLNRRLLRFVTFCNRTRMALTGVYLGDQGLFVRPDALAAAGGVPQVPLMEDATLCRRLHKHGRVRLLPDRLGTSPRRFLRHGVIRQLLLDTALLAAHRLGLDPARLHGRYDDDNHQAPAPLPQGGAGGG
ncbi:MAG: glycosyltransferase family 2 protein [Planctomycetota bacterium]